MKGSLINRKSDSKTTCLKIQKNLLIKSNKIKFGKKEYVIMKAKK